MNRNKYRSDSQKELFFQSLLSLSDDVKKIEANDAKMVEAKDEKKKETNTVSIFRKLFAMQPFSLPRLFQNKKVDQRTESHSTKYPPMFEPRVIELKPTQITVKPAEPGQQFNFSPSLRH